MYDFIEALDSGINSRYLTVMRNIRATSNSFYDSYLDLLEETIKSVADKFNFTYDDSITCGQLIKKPEMKAILVDKLGIDNYTYGKFSDYSRKINKHKHHLEKSVSLDTVINYMKIYDSLICKYANLINVETPDALDIEYLSKQFGLAERENKELKEEAMTLRNELLTAAKEKQISDNNITKLKSIINDESKTNRDLEEENLALTKEISKLKDIKLNSLEIKLDKSINILNELQNYLIESRIATSHVSKLISGYSLSDEELQTERLKLEASRHGK